MRVILGILSVRAEVSWVLLYIAIQWRWIPKTLRV